MRRKAQTSDVQLHIGESRDSGFASEPVIGPRFARTRWTRPGMTVESRDASEKGLFRGMNGVGGSDMHPHAVQPQAEQPFLLVGRIEQFCQ
jgi:hypothetical protein